jgi:Ni/Fe-hydrogenase 1 B-type cytochrome subunit
MSIIEPVKQDVQHSHQIKRYSASLRLWHWANMIIISGSLITVLINSTITNKHKTSVLIKGSLQTAGANVTDAQVKEATHALSDSVWDVHVYFGYCLAGLLVFRLLLEFFELADQKFIQKIKSAYTQFNIVKKNREMARNELTVKIIYASFYLLLIIMVVTGLSLAFEDALAVLKPIRHNIKSVHGFCMYLILAFIVVHLAGVFLAERKNGKGIVSDMINGGSEGVKA